jgi:hypothetical protein
MVAPFPDNWRSAFGVGAAKDTKKQDKEPPKKEIGHEDRIYRGW